MSDHVSALKDRHRTTWAAGNYPKLAELVIDCGSACVEAAAIEPGMRVLDVATGSGNGAIPAARAGGEVTALDLVPDLVDAARERAEGAGVEIEWVVGDAEEMPFADESFDRVMSSIGIQFAPRHEVVAREVGRVLRPGGRLVLANWTRTGAIGQLFKLVGEYGPPQPAFVSSPSLWGDEEHVRSLFADQDIELTFHSRDVLIPFGSPEEYIAYFEEEYGPTLMLKKALKEKGTWDEFRSAWQEMLKSFQTPDGIVQEYFVIVGEKAG